VTKRPFLFSYLQVVAVKLHSAGNTAHHTAQPGIQSMLQLNFI